VLRVREMASVQVTPGGRSLPCGRGGREEAPDDADGLEPLVGGW
jgi:hypothetical protein